MQTELVRVVTGDGLMLDGVLHQPCSAETIAQPVDAFLLVHGTGGNFYAPGVLETFSRQSVEAGVTTLRVNTRGHDGLAWIPGTPRSVRGGAAYEKVSEARWDLRAWIELLCRRGCERIALVGHSMGGIKAAYTLAHEELPAVAALVLIAAPRLCHRELSAHPRGEPFRAAWAEAERSVAAGEPDRLLAVQQPLPCLLTAAGFLEKYGPEETYDLLRLLPRVSAPVLAILGSRSPAGSIAFDGLAAALRKLSGQQANLTWEEIEGANTNFVGHEKSPFVATANWLARGREA
jgi:pimeloyl-ACP methyl ester carboxylesterase